MAVIAARTSRTDSRGRPVKAYRVRWRIGGGTSTRYASVTLPDEAAARMIDAWLFERGWRVERDDPDLAREVARLRGGALVESTRPFGDPAPVSAYSERYVAAAEARGLARNTLQNYQRAAALLDAAFGALDVRTLTTAAIDAERRRLIAEGRSPYAVAMMISIWRRILSPAWKPGQHRVRDDDPFADLPYSKRLRRRKSEPVFLSQRDVDLLLTAAASHRVQMLAWLCLEAGLRHGEALGLQRRHIVKQADGHYWLTIVGQFHDGSQTPPKTDDSTRTIPISDALAKAMLEVTSRAGDYVIAASFGKRPGQTLSEDTTGRAWTDTVNDAREAGLSVDRVRVHDLRHTCGSRMLEKGVTLAYVSQFLGHASLAITADIYGHIGDAGYGQIREAAAVTLPKPGKANLRAV